MAKIYGLFGSMTGKLADVVMVVRNGAQVARKYQPVVANPSTPAQVAARARMKLMSQLAEVVGRGLGFRRSGLVSARNQFVSANYASSSYAGDQASIDMLALDLSGGVISIPGVRTPARASNVVEFALASSPVGLDGVIYVLVETGADNRFSYVTSVEVTEPGLDGHYGGSTTAVPSALGGYIYAYGFRFLSSSARAKFGMLMSSSGNGVLAVLRSFDETEVELTRTTAIAFTAVN